MHLGVFQVFVVAMFSAAAAGDVWGVGATLPEDAAHELSVQRLRHDPFDWYSSEPGWTQATPFTSCQMSS